VVILIKCITAITHRQAYRLWDAYENARKFV
jgi:hypothetical protein